MNVIPSVRALPARVVPLPGESLMSLVRRTAAAMGYEGPHRLRALIVDVGKVQANVNVLRPGPILDILAVLLRQPPEMLLSMTVHRFAPTLVFPGEPSQTASLCDSKTTLKYFARGHCKMSFDAFPTEPAFRPRCSRPTDDHPGLLPCPMHREVPDARASSPNSEDQVQQRGATFLLHQKPATCVGTGDDRQHKVTGDATIPGCSA